MPSDSDRESDLSFGDFTIVRADERVLGPSGPLKLGRKAYRLLLMLAEREGQLLTKDALFASVWDGTIVSESALTSVIKELRRALDDQPVDPRYIESVYGRGYRLLPPVTRCAPARVRTPDPPAFLARNAADRPLGQAPLLFVPPFDDSAIADTDRHLGAVLHEEILIALSRFRDIRLVSEMDPASEAGRFGERDYRLSVRLLRHGGGIQAFTRISRLSSGAIIWADQILLEQQNLSHGAEELTRSIAGAALPRLYDNVLRNLPPQPSDAYDHYFTTRLRMIGLNTLEEARELTFAWERLIAIHPDLVQAYPPLIRLYNTDFGFTGLGATGESERRRAYELAHKVIAIDPTESHLHTVKGWCHLWAGEAAPARQHFDEAFRINPYNQIRLVEVATGLMFLDELNRAAELLSRCRSLTPFATEGPLEEEGLLYLLQREFDTAATRLAQVARRTISSDLYALLAAAGAGTADARERARAWRSAVAARWCGPGELSDEQLLDWVLRFHPFQQAARREWVLELLQGVLKEAVPEPPRIRAPAPREMPSSPAAGGSKG